VSQEKLSVPVFGVTILAINWPILFWLERNFAFLAAISTSGFVHLPTGSHVCLFLGPAFRTSLGGILEAFFLIELLFIGGPNEFITTVFTL